MCDEKLPFVCLAQELCRQNIPHSGLQVEANATSLVLKLLTLPQPDPSLSDSSKVICFCNFRFLQRLQLIQFSAWLFSGYQ